MTYGTAAVANGAYFIGGSSNSGSGSYRALYKLKANGEQSGYNRPGVFDSSVLGGDTHIITKSELTSTNDGQYYIFSLDLNEGNEGLISLDEFRIYTGSSDPAPLPNTEADLDKLGILRFNMNETENNHILLQAGVSGSGQSDMYVFVPTASLENAADSDQVYLYSSFGGFKYEGEAQNSHVWASSSGDEEWSIPYDEQPQFVPPSAPTNVPEPSSLTLILGATASLLLHRKRP
ncbi:hypothetical protein Rhal01_03611 [Rubritalea halochordaticola]|uniref:PEP-CTERM sorting domain-containing protein n=1 Tax=Rubritalea halochordaticola TaxID=714537 RepID=A0ABP9V470_9BACT